MKTLEKLEYIARIQYIWKYIYIKVFLVLNEPNTVLTRFLTSKFYFSKIFSRAVINLNTV